MDLLTARGERFARAGAAPVAVLVACIGCRRSTQNDSPVPDAPSAAPSPPPRPDGTAYLAVRGTGVLRIADGAMTTAYASTKDVHVVRVGPRDAVYALSDDALVRVDAAPAAVLTTKVPTSPVDLAITSDETAYMLGYAGSLWELAHGTSTLLADPPGGRHCAFIALDAKDALYCGAKGPHSDSGTHSVLRWSGQGWSEVELPSQASESFIDGMYRSSDGRLIVDLLGRALAIGPDGVPVPLTPTADGASAAPPRPPTGGGPFAVDAIGRRWVAPDVGGFRVIAADGTVTSWSSCSSLGDVLDFAVIGSGPTLPADVPGPIRGSVRGRLVRKGHPLAGVIVYLTSRALLGGSESNGCELREGGDLAAVGVPGESARTDAKGAFVLDDVPRETLGLGVAGADGKPVLDGGYALGAECCRQMKDATGVDLGTIELPAL
jgi:hypothetical protein